MYPELAGACPLKEEISQAGFDMLIMRELTGGLYFGERKTVEENGVRKAIDTLTYDENEIRRIAIKGFEIAMKRRKKVTSVDKANVLDTSRLWRKTMHRLSEEYPEVEYSDILVDNTAMQLIRNPMQFDVVSGVMNHGNRLDEPATVLDIMQTIWCRNRDNEKCDIPFAVCISKADTQAVQNVLSENLKRMLLDVAKEADEIEDAVNKALDDGYRTGDIYEDGFEKVSCSKMGDIVAANI